MTDHIAEMKELSAQMVALSEARNNAIMICAIISQRRLKRLKTRRSKYDLTNDTIVNIIPMAIFWRSVALRPNSGNIAA